MDTNSKDAKALLNIIDERIEFKLQKSNISKKYSGVVQTVSTDGSSATVKLSAYNVTYNFLNKCGEVLNVGDSVYIEAINGNMSNGIITERFGILPPIGGVLADEIDNVWQYIPVTISELVNDSGFLTESGVTTIVDGTVTTDYVNALGITAAAIQIKNASDYVLLQAGGTTVKVGDFIVGRTALKSFLTYGKFEYNDSNNGVYLGTDGIGLGTNFFIDALGNANMNAGNIGGWDISSQGLSSKGGSQTVTQSKLTGLSINSSTGNVSLDSSNLFVYSLIVNRKITISGITDGVLGIFTNSLPEENEKLIDWQGQLLYNGYEIPSSNKYAYLVFQSTSATHSVDFDVAPAINDTVGMFPGDAPKGFAGLTWGTNALAPDPKMYGASRIRFFAGEIGGDTPSNNSTTPCYITESGLAKFGSLIVDRGIYSEGSDGKYVLIKDGKITFGQKGTRNIFEQSVNGMKAIYYYGETPIEGFRTNLTYTYPGGSYADIYNTTIH